MVQFCRMAANSKMSRRAGEDEQYTFCWKLFTSWDFMIGLAETAKNKIAEIVTIFKVREGWIAERNETKHKNTFAFAKKVPHITCKHSTSGFFSFVGGEGERVVWRYI